MIVKLFAGKNNSVTQLEELAPWEFKPNVPPEATANKATYAHWRLQKETDHCVFTGYVGLNPKVRINKETNPMRSIRAIVVDFDADIDDSQFDSILKRCPADLKPTWASRSPSGLGARLVYLLEKEMPMDSPEVFDKFRDVARKELQLEKIFAGFDEPAWKNISALFDVGFEWKHLGDNFIPINTINHWLTIAVKRAKFNKVDVDIPLEDVYAEVERQFPGAWTGEFEENARGPAFWTGGTNPSAAIVTKVGMLAFSTPELMNPWGKVLGQEFVRKYQQNKIGGAIAETWFDGKHYYRKKNDRWSSCVGGDFRKYLRVIKGLSEDKKGANYSEVDEAEIIVQEMNHVQGAVPVLYDPRDLIERDGERLLNISYVKAVQPANTVGAWGEGFPWIANFLDNFFEPCDARNPLEYFLAWLQRYYGGAVQCKMVRGHMIFIVGGVESGKTLLSLRIIGALLGGTADASDYVVRGSEFNKNLAEKGHWAIDDGQVAIDTRTHTKFTEMVKKLAANPIMNYRKMYSDSMNNEWSGRLVITLNDDSSSLGIIPDLSMSIEDKIMVFKAKGGIKFPPSHVLEPMIVAELPFFARWILEWKAPEHIMIGGRFGVQSYIDDTLRAEAAHSGQTGDLIELVEMWIKRCRPQDKHGKLWHGRASEWWTEVATDDVLRPLINKFTVKQIAKKFSDAARLSGSKIGYGQKSMGHGNRYTIDLNEEDGTPSKPTKPFNPVAPDAS